MKKAVLFLLAFVLVAGCATESKNQFTGIDYSAYEMPRLRSYDDFTSRMAAPSVLDEFPGPSAEQDEDERTLLPDEDFTSEEITSSYGRYTDVTVVAAAKRIKLGSAATIKHMNLLQRALDVGYKTALRTYRPAGFTYTVSSVGAANPLSDIEVNCILGEGATLEAAGQQTCQLFFSTVVQEYNKLFLEAKRNGTL